MGVFANRCVMRYHTRSMNIAPLMSARWYAGLSPDEAGIWTTRGGRCAIGIVLLAQQASQIVAVQKAAIPGYEFSDYFALPGGLIRVEPVSSTFPEAVEPSLCARAFRECGLPKDRMKNLRLIDVEYPVTSYSAKGRQRFTLVLAARCDISDFRPAAADRSVSRAFLLAPPFSLRAFAPANRLILAHCFPDTASSAEDRLSLEEARLFCRENAKTLGPLI
jgi:hypothetical protein